MAAGRPPKPPEAHRLAGNPGKRPLSETISPRPDPGAEVPVAPAHLDPLAREVWASYAAELHRLRLLTTVDLSMFEMFCSAYATWRQYEGLAVAVGPQVAVSMGYRNAADRQREQCTRLAALFGLEPKSRNAIKTIPTGQTSLPSVIDDGGNQGKRAEELRKTFYVAGSKR